MSIKAEFQVDQVIERLNRSSDQLRQRVFNVMEEYVEKTVEAAQQSVPVRTGFLQGSIMVRKVDPLNLMVEAGAYAPYAAFVEWGTSRMAARPFWTPHVYFYAEEMRRALLELGVIVL